jgi:osmoprotectant transport system ATP-binding protein
MAVTLHQVGKEYAGNPVIRDISVCFPEDSVTAIIGRSGSGKSTLLRMINGLVRPDRGSLEVLGEPIDYGALVALRRRIGYAVQGTGLFPHLTVSENISLSAKLEGWDAPRILARMARLRELVQLDTDLLDRYPFELSGGQQQRVGLARAMVLNPPLLLLDEPFAALDPLTRLDIHEQLQHLQHLEPRSILLVTHDMREALKLADRVLLLEGGRVLVEESSDRLLARYPDLEAEYLLLELLGEAA